MPETATRAYSVGERVVILLRGEWIWPATIVSASPTPCRCGATRYVTEHECDGCDEWNPEPQVNADGDEVWPMHQHHLTVPGHDFDSLCECGWPKSEHTSPPPECAVLARDADGSVLTFTDEQAAAFGLTITEN